MKYFTFLRTNYTQHNHSTKQLQKIKMQPLQPQLNPSKLDSVKFRKPQKITQLLCLDQNFQLKSIFSTWLSESFKYLPGWLDAIYLELQLLINFIEYRFTVSKDKPQVGDYLQNIKYKKLSKNIKILFLLLDIVGPYLKKKFVIALEKIVENHQKNLLNFQQQVQGQKVWNKIVPFIKKVLRFICLFDKIWALASFLNLAIFIKQGKYRSVAQRILSMQMQFANPQNSRVLDFTLMNRNIIWEIYEMVLKNVLPYLYKFLGSGLKNVFYLHSYMGVQDKQDQEVCVLCGDTPTMALKAEPCGHFCCFYCSKTFQQKPSCKKCGQDIQNWAALYA